MFEFNPHPPVSAIPGVLFCAAFILEMLALLYRSETLRNSVRVIVTLAIILTPITYLTGYLGATAARNELTAIDIAESEKNPASAKTELLDERIEVHRATGRLLLFSIFPLGLFTLLSQMKDQLTGENAARIAEMLFRLFLIITVISALSTSYLGGRLVFSYGAGVSAKHLKN